MLNKDLKITIVGLGVLGGSYAKGFANAGIQVNAIDVNEESLQKKTDGSKKDLLPLLWWKAVMLLFPVYILIHSFPGYRKTSTI